MSTPNFTIRTPVDLVALAPIVLGFEPADSVVIESFGGSTGTFHARVDLPDNDEDQADIADLLVDAAMRNRVRQVAVLIYCADADRARRQGSRCEQMFADQGIVLLEVLHVTGGRYHLIGSGRKDPAGTAYDLSTHPFTTRHVMQGHVVHSSREELAQTLGRRDPEESAEIAKLAERIRADLEAATSGDGWAAAQADARWLRGRVKRFLRTGALPTTDEAARILVLCEDATLRDVVWTDVSRADAERHVELWSDLVRRAPDELLPEAAGVLALAAWIAGDGALAWCAIERAGEIGAETFLTRHVGEVLASATPPSIWRPIPSEDLLVLQP